MWGGDPSHRRNQMRRETFPLATAATWSHRGGGVRFNIDANRCAETRFLKLKQPSGVKCS